MGTNSTKEENEAPDPIPESATVIWKTPDGKEHRQTLIVAKKTSNIATWTGTVWFKFTDKGVEVVPLSKKEMDDLADARKDYPWTFAHYNAIALNTIIQTMTIAWTRP